MGLEFIQCLTVHDIDICHCADESVKDSARIQDSDHNLYCFRLGRGWLDSSSIIDLSRICYVTSREFRNQTIEINYGEASVYSYL